MRSQLSYFGTASLNLRQGRRLVVGIAQLHTEFHGFALTPDAQLGSLAGQFLTNQRWQIARIEYCFVSRATSLHNGDQRALRLVELKRIGKRLVDRLHRHPKPRVAGLARGHECPPPRHTH